MEFFKRLPILLLFVTVFGCLAEQIPRNRPLIDQIEDPNNPTPEEPTFIQRPDGQVFIQPGFCACKDGEQAILGDCTSFCAGTTQGAGQTTLYLDIKLGEEILLNQQLGGLANWCATILNATNEDGSANSCNPSCKFNIQDSNGNQSSLDLTIKADNPNLSKVEIPFPDGGGVAFDTTYLGHIEETCSGAKSDTIQFRRITGIDIIDTLAPLKIDPVYQYTCMNAVASEEDNGDDNGGSTNVFTSTAFRLHFYYVDFNAPPIIPPVNNQVIYCHDIFKYGVVDRAQYPRLELVPGAYNLWSMTDSRFYDLNPDPITNTTNGRLDIHDVMDQLIREKEGPASNGLTFDIFSAFNWANFPASSADGNSSPNAQPVLGFVMSPFVDPATNKSFCPTFADYNDPTSSTAIQVMKDVVGIDTEGLYLGEKNVETAVIDGTTITSPPDYIVIKESTLKQIWFYFENEQAIAPNSITEGTKTLYFYYPPNFASPYIQGSDQSLYTVRHPTQIGSGDNAGNGSSSVFQSSAQIPHDKKFACGPKGN